MNGISFFDGSMNGIKGVVAFHQCDENTSTSISINLEGFKDDNPKGIHIHTYGDLTQGCKSACDHFNPHNKKHGNYLIHGNDRHVGDLINNIIPKKGVVNIKFNDSLVNLWGENNVIGRMIVIHSDRDDLGIYRNTDNKSATTGNAGDRIACAIIGLSKPNHF